jgi:hypothetical protein
MRNVSKSSWQRSAYRAVAVVALGALVGMAPSAARAACVGDCDSSGEVTVDEIIVMVNISLEVAPLSGCTVGDANGDGAITVEEIIQAVNNALTSCPPEGGCGNGTINAPAETCDDGGQCVGGNNAGTHCTAETDCHGNGVCVGGTKTGTSCAAPTDCPEGSCVHCRPFGGDGCAANCTAETTIPYVLIPGVVMGLDIKPGTSGAVVHGDVLTIPLAITGQQSLVIGKKGADGNVPFVIPAASVMFPKIPVATLACACVRGVAFKTCGGTLFDVSGEQSPSCTDGFNGKMTCPPEKACAEVHGPNNSATGTLGCADTGLNGTNVTLTQDSGGETGTPGRVVIELSGSGPKGSAILLNSTAIGTVVGSCAAAGAAFCTPTEPVDTRGTPQTLPFTTGMATAVVKNANFQDFIDIGPFSATGSPQNCDNLTSDPPSTAGFATVGAFPALGQPTLGDIVVTNQFFAQ